jgi:hypothetical protein
LCANAGSDQLTAAGLYRPATGLQRAERQALMIGRQVQGMRTWSRTWLGLPGVSRAVQIQVGAEWARGAVLIWVLHGTEQRLARGETVVQPTPGGVREGAGTIGIDPVALGQLVHIQLGEPLY